MREAPPATQAEKPVASPQVQATFCACGRCGRVMRRSIYEVRSPRGLIRRCLRCALGYSPLVRRSVLISFVVGTVLTAINQGNTVATGDYSPQLLWKVPLTYAVPYAVSMTGALLAARTRVEKLT